ncbi:MAG: hypothetical protein H0U69_06985, partial [Trueperaceae bacterium]|nr:hypothetical protein [Trueperaceae bacterium]
MMIPTGGAVNGAVMVGQIRSIDHDGRSADHLVDAKEVWELAGRTFGVYARQRRSANVPRRLIADYLIAAHAAHHGL